MLCTGERVALEMSMLSELAQIQKASNIDYSHMGNLVRNKNYGGRRQTNEKRGKGQVSRAQERSD